MNGIEKLFALDQDNLQKYRVDGVVHLKGAFQQKWLSLLRQGLEKNMRMPSPRFEARDLEGGKGRYCEDFWVWSLIPEFETFVRSSPAANIAAQLMCAKRINLVMDNWFVREAGAKCGAPWHHDISYFDFEGTMGVLWIPLENQNSSIEFVRGSHLWNRLFMRVWFKDHQPAAPSQWVNGKLYEEPIDVNADRNKFDILSFDMAEGDCLFFDIRTLHGSPATAVPKQSQSRYTLRLASEDARIQYRGDWAKAERRIFEEFGHRDGDELNSDFFPALWTASDTG